MKKKKENRKSKKKNNKKIIAIECFVIVIFIILIAIGVKGMNKKDEQAFIPTLEENVLAENEENLLIIDVTEMEEYAILYQSKLWSSSC